MDDNRYRPPESDPRPSRAPGSPWRGILIGLSIDLGGTLLLGIVIGVVYAMSMAMDGASPDAINARLSHIEPWSALGLLSGLSGLLCTLLGGYACARIAGRQEYQSAAIMGALSVAVGCLLGGNGDPLYLIVSALLTWFTAVLGAHWYCQRQARPAS